jgi:hypothetical protein
MPRLLLLCERYRLSVSERALLHAAVIVQVCLPCCTAV